VSGPNPAAVFVKVPINNIVAAVFDTPVAAVDGKDALGVGLLRRSAGDAVGDFTGVFAGLFVCGLALNDKSLPNARKIQIAVEFGCGPDFADFDSAVVRGVAKDKIGVPPVFEKKGNVLKNSGLVVFHGEVVMSVSLFDQIDGDITLG
jgi:hypothetical protein